MKSNHGILELLVFASIHTIGQFQRGPRNPALAGVRQEDAVCLLMTFALLMFQDPRLEVAVVYIISLDRYGECPRNGAGRSSRLTVCLKNEPVE